MLQPSRSAPCSEPASRACMTTPLSAWNASGPPRHCLPPAATATPAASGALVTRSFRQSCCFSARLSTSCWVTGCGPCTSRGNVGRYSGVWKLACAIPPRILSQRALATNMAHRVQKSSGDELVSVWVSSTWQRHCCRRGWAPCSDWPASLWTGNGGRHSWLVYRKRALASAPYQRRLRWPCITSTSSRTCREPESCSSRA
mmetsp:Transcript_123254/g.354145  ORF Transcript_123254/g.354145 Transcript_123254/m.354145 type:complete len:201 (-) Transcript_123254:1069-1671(-)